MTQLDWSLPYPSQREGVLARNVVATSQPLAAQAGLRILQAGGNAVDAAIAAAAALTVVEPTSNGLGSDAFAIVWKDGALRGLNASGRSPAALNAERFEGQESMSKLGWDAVTVPGAVSAWSTLSREMGRLPFEQLLEPSVEYARDGFLVSRQTAHAWRRSHEVFGGFEAWNETFCPGGAPPQAGDHFRCEDQARTLEAIARSRGDAMYSGELAERIASCAEAADGLISLDDLARETCDWVDPLSISFHGYDLHELPPNGQGLVALIAMGLLKRTSIADHPVDSADSLHLQIEAMKLAFADGYQHIADPEFVQTPPDALLSDGYLDARAAMIDPARAGAPAYGAPKPGGTVYLATADAEGCMVSFIQSNYMGFGSGVVIPGTGIAMQNRGACFELESGHPNQVAGGKRPYHTIIPGFVTRDGAPVMSFGVMGGFMQPQGHAQVMVRVALAGQNPLAALDAPRWQVFKDHRVGIESGFASSVYDDLRARGHDLTLVEEKSVEYGGGQAIYRLADGYFAASDMRRDGQAVGY